MKTTLLHSLLAIATALVSTASVEAHGPAMCTSNYSQAYTSYAAPAPATVQAPAVAPASSGTPVAPPVETLPAPAPQAHITVLPTVASTSTKASIHTISTKTSVPVKTVSNITPISGKSNAVSPPSLTKTVSDLTKTLDSTLATNGDPSAIADSIKGLVGTWMAVARDSQGELSTVQLQLDDRGWATLSVPGADGKVTKTIRKAELANNELKLTGGPSDMSLGKLVDFNARQMVLEQSGGDVTFVRP